MMRANTHKGIDVRKVIGAPPAALNMMTHTFVGSILLLDLKIMSADRLSMAKVLCILL